MPLTPEERRAFMYEFFTRHPLATMSDCLDAIRNYKNKPKNGGVNSVRTE